MGLSPSHRCGRGQEGRGREVTRASSALAVSPPPPRATPVRWASAHPRAQDALTLPCPSLDGPSRESPEPDPPRGHVGADDAGDCGPHRVHQSTPTGGGRRGGIGEGKTRAAREPGRQRPEIPGENWVSGKSVRRGLTLHPPCHVAGAGLTVPHQKPTARDALHPGRFLRNKRGPGAGRVGRGMPVLLSKRGGILPSGRCPYHPDAQGRPVPPG